jgi:lambda family phage portal protein
MAEALMAGLPILSRLKSAIFPGAGSAIAPRATARYLRDTRSAIIDTRGGSLREHRDDVRASWQRSAGLAMDLIQNSGRLRGAADQVVADTMGIELQCQPRPDFTGLGWGEKEIADWIKLVKTGFKVYCWDARECDLRGKLTIPQQAAVVLRWEMAYGEATGMMSYMSRAERRRYGITTGTKICLVEPRRLSQHTDISQGWFQGVKLDGNGRPTAYRFVEDDIGQWKTQDYAAYDAAHNPQVFHIFDPVSASDVRGISRMAAGFRKHIQHELLVDATLQTSILQTIFAATLTSAAPSAEAFEAIEALKDSADTQALSGEFMNWYQGAYKRSLESGINISGDPQVSHLAPGEELKIIGAATPGADFLPFSMELSRDMSRAIGVTFGSFTNNFSNATYSSTRMENATVRPVVLRRREHVAAPFYQMAFEAWLDESIGEGRIPFKGGYEIFRANRKRLSWAQWYGPAAPTADDHKSEKARTERLENGTSSVEVENSETGVDSEELYQQRLALHKRCILDGIPSPYERSGRSGPLMAEPGAQPQAVN